MLTRSLYLDFEIQSRISLKKAGVYRYAVDDSTQVICAGWALVDHRLFPNTLRHGPYVWTRPSSWGGLLSRQMSSDLQDFVDLAREPDVRLVAHNAELEREILRHKYGIDVPLSRISCTAARSARMSLPRSLEAICVALGLDERKDVDAHRVLMKLAKPRRPSKDDRSEFWTEERKPEDFARIYDYCLQDVIAMMAVDMQVPELSEEERAAWEVTVEMNERGVLVDVPAVRAALDICQRERAAMAAEFHELFKVKIGHAPGAAKALGLPDVQKATVRDALRTETDPVIKRGLRLRQRYAKASVDKLKAFLERVQEDGRVRGSLTYCGAERTLRWSGSGIQPQNFPRGMGKKTDLAFRALHQGALELAYDDPVLTISDMLKGFIAGPLLVGDFSTVEVRILAWLVGQENLLKLLREGGDPYCDLGGDIFGKKVTKADEKERFLGKQGVLSSGYQIGWRHFRDLLDVQHDVQISEELAKRAVYGYRRKYPEVVLFWSRIERAVVYVLKTKSTRVRVTREGLPPLFAGIRMIHGRPFLYIELPSGRALHYAYPQLVETGYEDHPLGLEFLGRSPYTHRWEMTPAHGGMLTGHVVQSLARDLMAAALLRLKQRGLKLLLTCHDEAVAEDASAALGDQLPEFTSAMVEAPAWAAGAPLGAECYRCVRYRKN